MVFRHPDKSLDAAVAALFESAKKSEQAAPRKHHLIPASYLVRWEVASKLRVTETSTTTTYLNSADNAARETDFYRMESDDLDSDEIPPLLFETILSRLEGAAPAVIDLLIEGGPTALGHLDALAFAQFLAFQFVRGRARRQEIMDIANNGMLLMWGSITDEGIVQRLRDQGDDPTPAAIADIRKWITDLKAGKIRVGLQQAALIGYAAMAAEEEL